MRVSPKFLAILAASGVLVGLSATQARADADFGVDVVTPEARSTQATPLDAAEAEAMQSAEFLQPPAPAAPDTPAAVTVSAESADSPALMPTLDGNTVPESAAVATTDDVLPLAMPEVTTLIPVSTVPEDLQSAVDEYRPTNTVDLAVEAPEPTLDLSRSPSLQGLPPSPTELSQGPRQISPEDAERILDGAVERRNQSQTTETPTPEEAEGEATESEATDDTPAAETEVPPAAETPNNEPTSDEPASAEPEAEPRVLVAEVLVQAPQGELTPDLLNLVYSVIETRAGRTTTRTQLQQDINSIFATGFFADVDALPEDTDLGVRVTFIAQPNPVLTDVRITGNQVLPQSEIDRIFADQKGDIINLLDFQDGILELNQWYQQNGYVLAQVVAAPRVSDDGVVTLEVAEGVIESIEVRFVNDQGETVDAEGNPLRGRTQDYIITREFETQPGDVFNQAQIERDFQRVFGLQIFEDIVPGLEPGDENPREVKLIVNVTERSTGSVAAGLGFNFTGDIFGTVSYRQDNFGGNNQKLAAEVQLSTRDLLFDVSFTDPWIGGDPFRTSYTANAFARSAINLNFDGGPNEINLPDPNNPGSLVTGDRVRVRRLGGGVTFSRPLNNGWTLGVGTLVQNISIRDASGNVSPVDAAGNPLSLSGTGIDNLWTIPLSATLDRRNDAFNPTSGSILRLNSEQSIPIGRGSIFMNRLRGSYSQYFPVSFINLSEGPQALAFNIQAGTILGDVPPYEAFALGGTNSIRGYDEGEVGGGRSYAQFTAEYRFPLFSFLGGALFFDAATDFGSSNSVLGTPGPSRGKPGSGFGYGAGVRVQTPLGPLRIDYGFSNQGEGRIHFGIGERF